MGLTFCVLIYENYGAVVGNSTAGPTFSFLFLLGFKASPAAAQPAQPGPEHLAGPPVWPRMHLGCWRAAPERCMGMHGRIGMHGRVWWCMGVRTCARMGVYGHTPVWGCIGHMHGHEGVYWGMRSCGHLSK